MTVCGEKVTGVCVMGKCPHFKRCHPVVWDKYGKIKPKTNEEWFNSLSTEEKAKYIAKSMFFYDSQFGLTMVEALRKSIEYEDGLNETIEHDVVVWLKEKHNESV